MVTAIVLAAGRSTRMGGGSNKQFIELLGKPIIWYSLTAFELCGAVDAVILVRRPDYAQEAEQIIRAFGFHKVVAVTDGGVGQPAVRDGRVDTRVEEQLPVLDQHGAAGRGGERLRLGPGEQQDGRRQLALRFDTQLSAVGQAE